MLFRSYASTAVVADGTPMPEYRRDAELYAQPTTWPGAKVPHTWVTRGGAKVSTLDLGGRGAFTVYTGIGGDAWVAAAAAASASLGVDVRVVCIGHGQEFEDPFGTWAELREVEDTGVVLTRPDNYVAFRAQRAPGSDAEAAAARKSQVRTVDRSERIRTYNFPENRISDHRVNFKANNLDEIGRAHV